MSLQENPPRQAYLPAPHPNLRTEVVVQIPDEKATQEHAQSVNDHEPHRLENLQVALVLEMLPLFARYLETSLLARQAIFFEGVAPPGPQACLHGVHAAQDDDCGQESVGILVEDRVLQVMVVEGDEDCETEEGDGENEADNPCTRV